MSSHLQEQCLDVFRNDLRWKTNKIILANQRQHIIWHSCCVLCVCAGKEEKSLINEDKQEALPKLSSQILFSHVVQVEVSGKKQLVL